MKKAVPLCRATSTTCIKLAGLEAVRQSFAEGVNLVLNPDNSQDQAIIDELAEWHERIVKANDSRPEPENLENPMNPENKDNIQTTSSNTTNSIEYEGRTQTVNKPVYRESDF